MTKENQLVADEPLEIDGVEFEYEGMTLTKFEVDRQSYAGNGAHISAGYIEGHPVDTMYVEFGAKDGQDVELVVLLRPDEVATIAWLCSGLLFSHEIAQLNEKEKTTAD